MAFGSRTVAQYDVGFNVLLGPFRAQLGEAAATYGRTTGQMSTEALRLSTRQADLAKAIQTYGAESVQAARKTVVLREEMARLAAANEKAVASERTLATAQNETAVASRRASTGGLLAQERAAGRFARGGFVGSGVGRSGLLFGSGAFVGGLAAVSGLKTVLDAAKQNEVAQAQLQVALHNSGLAWAANKGHIDEATGALTKLGFKEDETTAVIAANVRRFGDVNQALKATSIEADVARAKGISLADAQNIVQRASLGQSRSLLALGIIYTKSTANVDALKAETKHYSAEALAAAKAADAQANRIGALDAVNAKFHGNAAKFATTSAGKQLIFNSELNKTERIIGTALLPEFDRLITHFANYLDKLNRTGRLQRDVNTVIHDAGAAFHVMGAGVHLVEDVLGPLNNLLGGSEHTIRALTAALIAFKLRGAAAFVTGTREIGAAAALAAPEVAGLATAEAAAATNAGLLARIGAYTGAAGVGAGAAAGTGAAGLGGGVLSRVGGGLVGRILGVAASGFVLGSGGESRGVHRLGGSLDITVAPAPGGVAEVTYLDPTDGKHRSIIVKNGTNVGQAVIADIRKRNPGFGTVSRPQGTGIRPGVPGSRPSTGARSTRAGATTPPLVLGLTEAQQTALLRAEGTSGTGDDVRALNTQLGILNRLVTQKGLNAAQLNSLLQQRDSVLSQLDSLTNKAATAGNKAQTAADRLFRHQESLLKDELARAKLSSGPAAITRATKALSDFYLKEANNPALSQATQDLARSREIALKKTTDAVSATLKHQESVLKLAVEKAKLTTPTDDDVKAIKTLESFYAKEANDPKLTRAIRDTYKAKAVAEKLILQKLQKGTAGSSAADIREFLQEFTNVVGNYSSNVGNNPVTRAGKDGTHVTVIQQFPHPPTRNGNREAIFAYHAARAAFD